METVSAASDHRVYLGRPVVKPGKPQGNPAEWGTLSAPASSCELPLRPSFPYCSSPGEATPSENEPQIQQERKPLRPLLGAKIILYARAHGDPQGPQGPGSLLGSASLCMPALRALEGRCGLVGGAIRVCSSTNFREGKFLRPSLGNSLHPSLGNSSDPLRPAANAPGEGPPSLPTDSHPRKME